MSHDVEIRLRVLVLIPAVVVLAIGSASCGYCNRRPLITSISPTSATAGGVEFVLTVKGDNFVPGSGVVFNGLPVVTTYVNSTELLAEIPASNIAAPGTVLVFVFNPPGNGTYIFGFGPNNGCGGDSNGVSFTIIS
jgi:hypothetical protein